MDSSVIVGVLIWLAIFIFIIAMIINTAARKTNGNLNIKNLRKEQGFICGGLYKHTVGLPIAEGVKCQVLCFNDRIEVRFNSMKFNLDKPKIVDICLKTDVEIQKQYVSSAGGAVGGALLFGPVGALIGGRAKKKQIRNESTYLIITYKNEDEIKYLGFDVTGLKSSANRFVYIFKNSTANSSQAVDLGSLSTGVVNQNNVENTTENNIDVTEQIEKYYNLKEKGIITEEEFCDKKNQLLEQHCDNKKQPSGQQADNKNNVLQETPIYNANQYPQINTNPTVEQHKKIGGGTITLIVIGAVLLCVAFLVAFGASISSMQSTKTSQVSTLKQEETKNVIFDVNAFVKENRTVTEDELIKKIGKPKSTENWNYTTSTGEKYSIKTLYYGNYEYKFNNGNLVRITILEPIKFNSKNDFLEMFNVTKTKNSNVKDTGVAYRVTNSNIYDLWIGYDEKSKKTEWVHISYSNLFDK